MYRSFRKIKILFATFRKSLLSMLESSLFWLLERATRMQLWAFKFHGNPRIPVRVRTHTRRPGIIVRVQLHAEQRFSRRIIPRCVCTYLKFPSRWMDSHACIDYDEIHVNTHTHRVVLCPKQTLKTKSYNKVPVVRDAGATEVAVRPIDDVCPWEAVPGPSTEHGSANAVSSGGTASADQARHVWDSGGHVTIAQSAEATRASRKNSAQLDSCSSSSDVSLAIAEVSERLRKSCSLQHSGSVGRYVEDTRETNLIISRMVSVSSILSSRVEFSSGILMRPVSWISIIRNSFGISFGKSILDERWIVNCLRDD